MMRDWLWIDTRPAKVKENSARPEANFELNWTENRFSLVYA